MAAELESLALPYGSRSPGLHAIAVDLPGVGGSRFKTPPSRGHDIAAILHEFVRAKALRRVIIVGHDVGGQIAYRYARDQSNEVTAAVIMNVVVPGIPPWEEVRKNPAIWHFIFHSIPHLPEALVQGRERRYFDYFYDTIAHHRDQITSQARAAYVKAYRTPSALKTGFDWYRAFHEDALENASQALSGSKIKTPLLYLRGSREHGEIEDYLAGFRSAGFLNVHGKLLNDCGHFAPEEQPELVWRELIQFLGSSKLEAN